MNFTSYLLELITEKMSDAELKVFMDGLVEDNQIEGYEIEHRRKSLVICGQDLELNGFWFVRKEK